jgi:hypothetical protein
MSLLRPRAANSSGQCSGEGGRLAAYLQESGLNVAQSQRLARELVVSHRLDSLDLLATRLERWVGRSPTPSVFQEYASSPCRLTAEPQSEQMVKTTSAVASPAPFLLLMFHLNLPHLGLPLCSCEPQPYLLKRYMQHGMSWLCSLLPTPWLASH